MPRGDSRQQNKSEAVSAQPEAPSAKKSRKSYPGQMVTELPVPTNAAGTENPRQFLNEIAQPNPGTLLAQQSERNANKAGEPTEPIVRIEKLGETVGKPFSSQSEAESSAPAERVVHGVEKQIQPLARIENREERKASSLSARATSDQNILSDNEPPQPEPLLGSLLGNKGGLIPKSGFAPLPGRDIFKSPDRPAASFLATGRESDTPTIQVTIGRVEIRATLPTPPSRKTVPKSPAMGLDDYLKQRSGGRR